MKKLEEENRMLKARLEQKPAQKQGGGVGAGEKRKRGAGEEVEAAKGKQVSRFRARERVRACVFRSILSPSTRWCINGWMVNEIGA